VAGADPIVRARAARSAPAPVPVSDPDVVEAYLEDASNRPPGRASGLLRPANEDEAASFLRNSLAGVTPVLPQAARSSLTGGAVPAGEVVVSVERLDRIDAVRRHPGGARVSLGAGVRLRDLQDRLAEQGWYYPPVPTYQEAMIGGTVSTNAGGAATFKYGVTRNWVRGLRVLLFNGDVLEVERGEVVSRGGRPYRVVLSDGTECVVPVPTHRLPTLRKTSAGYHAGDPLDLVDLLIGSEGTLGLIAAITLDLVPLPPSVITGLAFLPGSSEAIRLAGELRREARRARERGDALGPDVRAIEFVDERCLDLLRSHGDARRLRIDVPPDAGAAVLVEMELAEPTGNEAAMDALEAIVEDRPGVADGPMRRLFLLLARHGAVEGLQLAFPEDAARRQALTEFREAVPKRVNEILAARGRDDPGIRKVGGDLIVPFDRLPEIFVAYEAGFHARGLEFAVWGHLSDGNLHPNLVARSAADVTEGEELQLEFAARAAGLGGCPLSEHGVGRSSLKQEILRRFVGDAAIEGMRAVKRGLDPVERFAPGVLFPPR
jgi:D-lactate dehydrogenase (cytochrome)